MQGLHGGDIDQQQMLTVQVTGADLAVVKDVHQHERMPAGLASSAQMVAGF